jgi:hypothetical protein
MDVGASTDADGVGDWDYGARRNVVKKVPS